MATETGRHFRKTFSGDQLGLCHILSLRSLGALAGFIVDGVAFVQGLEPVAADGGEVNEQIVTIVFRRNKTEPF